MVSDELFSGLDAGNSKNVKKTLRPITENHEFNTIIYSTYDIELAVELADSVYVFGYPSVEGEKDYGTIFKSFDMKETGMTR